MASLADVYRAINALREEGIVENYAVGEDMGAFFYVDILTTFDVDVFVVLPQQDAPTNLSRVYDWAQQHGCAIHLDHIIIHGVPVQILAASPGLESEAIERANVLTFDSVPVCVMPPEHLIALYIQTGGDKRRGRARDLFADSAVDKDALRDILERFNLIEKWQATGGETL